MSRTFYTLHALAEGQTGIAVLYGDGHSCTTIWSCSMERARHRASTNAFPAGQEVEEAVPLGVPDPRPLAPDQADRIALVIGDHIPAELVDRLRRTPTRDVRQG